MRTLKRYVHIVCIVLVWACMQATVAFAQTETPPQLGSIGDFIYALESTGNTPLGNALVTLWQNDVEIANTRTDEDGIYLFSGLPLGEYDVEVEIIADDIRESTDQAICYEGMSPAYVLDNGNDSRVTVMLTEQSPNTTVVDFGYACLSTVLNVGGSVYSVESDGNVPLRDVRVVLFVDSIVLAEVTTNENGLYKFDAFFMYDLYEDYGGLYYDTMSMIVEVDTSTLPEEKQQLSTIISPDNDGDNRVVVDGLGRPLSLTENNIQFGYSDMPVPLTVAYSGGAVGYSTNWLLIVAAGMTIVTSVGLTFDGRANHGRNVTITTSVPIE